MKKIVCMLFAIIMVLSVFSAVAENYGAKVLTPSMKVYLKPDASAEAAAEMAQGTAFTVTAISGDWARISYKGHEGFAQMKDIIFDKHVKAIIEKDAKVIYITKESVKDSKAFYSKLEAGTKVYVVGKNDEYLLIENLDGTALGIVKAANVKKVG